MKIFSGSSNKPLAEKIAKNLNLPAGRQGLDLSSLEIDVFPDSEKRVRVLENVVSEDCVVVQPTSTPSDSNYMELFFIVDALKRSGAKSVTAVVPYLGYQRQDHIFRDGEAVSLQVIIETLERVGVSKLITFDLHTIKIPEFFSIPVIHLSALPFFAEKIREICSGRLPTLQGDARSSPLKSSSSTRSLSEIRQLSSKEKRKRSASSFNSLASGQPSIANHTPYANSLAHEGASSAYTLVSPDMGGIRRIKILSEMLGNVPFAVIDKNRDLATGKVSTKEIQGDVKGKRAIIVDDMISTGKTIAKAVELLTKKGAKGILVFATHPVFSQDAKKTLSDLPIEKIYVTDTIYVPESKRFKKLEVLSVAKMISDSLE